MSILNWTWSFYDPFLLFVLMICSWPSVYHAWKGDRHKWIADCFRKYGKKIRIEPNTVLFRSPTASRDIYGIKANVKRAESYDALLRKEEHRNTITTTDNIMHTKRRRLLNLAFTDRSLRAATSFMGDHIDRWHQILVEDSDADWSEPLNFSETADALVFDILGDICYGKSFEIKQPGHNAIKAVPHAIVKTMRFIYPITRSPFVGTLPWLRPRGLSRLFKAIRSKPIKLYDDFVGTSVRERLDREKASKTSKEVLTREDMVHFLCNAKNPDTNLPAFSNQDIRAEVRLLLVAGSDSTSVTMSALFYFLAHHPRVYSKLVNEITGTYLEPEDIVPGPRLASCKYLRACIDETMRIAPAGLSELLREMLPGGIIIDGEYFPLGVIVGTARWADGHNEQVYGDPEIFRPERWIPDKETSAEEVARIRASFHPFSLGPFNCAGTNFALQELMLMVGKTVHRLEFQLASRERSGDDGFPNKTMQTNQNVPLFHLEDAFISVRDGPMLQFRKRGTV
ncbi:benzoate 4-monooxygenase cytochrome P450 [Massariosphaeria phaeospora]|uniref:Benzoate 4-monooxygenase cytochrome P450 n=1 Tax=Massariosphaeria phaeospora TaxID=100035 RepID=A0A7C8MGK0_9PLEO|nr:benzoate 4-monooxygenase cytochrome P450 [Massariosphaeria phaeospora]